MNHPRANRLSTGTRLRLAIATAVLAAFAVFVPIASADVTSVVTGKFASAVPGAHSNYTNKQVFSYTEAAPHDDDDDLRKWVIDGPAGQIGNPNSIPAADRCTLAEFNTTVALGGGLYTSGCPASSIVGAAAVTFILDANGTTVIDANGAAPNVGSFSALNPAFTGIAADPDNADLANAAPGTIYLLDNSPNEEIPVILATFFHTTASRTQSSLAPVTSGPDGDFRIRVIPTEDIPHRTVDHDADGGAVTPELPISVKAILQHLNGQTTGGGNFLTNPPRCGDWTTYSYATEYDAAGNSNANASPVDGDGETYYKATSTPTVADCSTTPAFGASLSATVVGGARDSNPTLNVVVSNPGDPGVGLPKKITTTLPATLTTDLQKIVPENICSIANRDAGTCQPSSKVGSVTVKTPFLTAGLSGDVYITQGDNPALPNLAIYVTGAISFRLDATNRFVGARGNQIETTFDNLPQTLFTEFALTIPGGTNTLLTIPPCKTDGSAPEDSSITSSLESYTGQTNAGTSATNFNGCYGTPKLSSPKRCVKYKLAVTPRNMLNSPGISKVELYVGKTKRSQRTRLTKDVAAPWKLQKRLGSKFKKGKKYYMYVKTTYKPTPDAPNGKVLKSRVGSFKRCK